MLATLVAQAAHVVVDVVVDVVVTASVEHGSVLVAKLGVVVDVRVVSVRVRL